MTTRASSGSEGIQGYTPANYISYSEDPQHSCHIAVVVEVDAPVSVCYDLWNDYSRLVEWLDLVAQARISRQCGRAAMGLICTPHSAQGHSCGLPEAMHTEYQTAE